MRFTKWIFLLAGILLIGLHFSTLAQDSTLHKADSSYHNGKDSTQSRPAGKPVLTVLLPLYLDSAFDAGGEYRYGKQFPRFLLPGLEFYEGVQLAIDSLNKEGLDLEVNIIDTRSSADLKAILQKPAVLESDLILGHVAFNELRTVADFASAEKIPFVNVNLPNDGGVTNNPYLVILNSTLQAHCEGIYHYLQQQHGQEQIIVFRKNGSQEDRLKSYLDEVAAATTGKPLKLKYVNLPADFQEMQLTPYLDSNRTNIILAGSLDEGFAKHLAGHLTELNKTYPVHLVGMPTWDGIRDFDKKDYQDLEIYYTIPFNPIRTDALSEAISTHFRENLFSRPSDMVFRGYETMYRFGKLLKEHGPNIASSIGEKKHRVFTDFNIQPVLLDRQKQQLDYFENKKLYVIRKLNGTIATVY